MKTVLVSNIPAPYREPVYEYVNDKMGSSFIVLYCQKRESDRLWNLVEGKYHKIFLKGISMSYNNYYKRHVHINFNVWKHLTKINPSAVITSGYNPTHIIAFLWTIFHKRKHIAMTDGWLKSEESLSFVHKIFRKKILSNTSAFIGASNQSIKLFIHYGAKINECFLSYLCGNNASFEKSKNVVKKWDIMFSGQFIKIKLPDFFCEVLINIKKKKPDLTVLLIGSGPLLESTLKTLKNANIDYTYGGFVKQENLPAFYCASRLFFFPTLVECWGVVVNEACAAGMPVITCDNTAVSFELVIHEKNGYILPLDAELWAEKSLLLLNNKDKLTSFSQVSVELVQKYNYQSAAQGIVDAVNYVETL